MADADRLAYSITETAHTLGVSRTTLYRMLADGTLTARKIGTRTVILAEDLRRLIDSLPAGEWK